MKSITHLSAFIIWSTAAVSASPRAIAAVPSRPDTRYALECRSSGAPFQALLNDVLVSHSDGKEKTPQKAVINFWLKSGKNTLRLLIPKDAVTNPGAAAECEIRVNHFSDPILAGGQKPGRLLTSVTLPATPALSDKMVTFSLTDKEAPPCKLWQAAKPFTLDDQAKEGILKLVGEYRTALEAQNLDRVVALEEFRTKDSYLCTDRPIEEYQVSGKEVTRLLLVPLAGGKFSLWDPSKAEIQQEAGGLVARVTVNGQVPISVTRKGGGPNAQVPINVYVAKVGGKWTLVR